MRSPMPSGCLALLIFAGVLLFPLFLANAMLAALQKLGLSPASAVLIAIGIFFGGLINIPVSRIEREEPLELPSLRMFGLNRFFPAQVQRIQYTVIAINVGGALIPFGVAIYELLRLNSQGRYALLVGLGAIALNVAACYFLARPVPNLGIALNPFVPALLAAACGLLLLPEFAPSVAFSAGVLGPLIGADLLHMDDIERIATTTASIGGAGTFDGIVLASLIATLLA